MFAVAKKAMGRIRTMPMWSLQASDRVYYVYQSLQDAEEAVAAAGIAGNAATTVAEQHVRTSELVAAAEAALNDDLNTPKAIALLSEPLKELNDLLHTKKVHRNCSASACTCVAVKATVQAVCTKGKCCWTGKESP
jgi:cysteinyl-tRNA synthetase